MGSLRDRLLMEGVPIPGFTKVVMQQTSTGYKSEAKSVPVPKDLFETGKTENEVRKDVNKMLQTYGYISRTIYTGGVPLGGGKLGTNPAKGIPDRIVTHPIKKQCFWVELKRNSGGSLSPEQQTFIWDLRNSGQTVFIITSAKMLETEMKKINLL